MAGSSLGNTTSSYDIVVEVSLHTDNPALPSRLRVRANTVTVRTLSGAPQNYLDILRSLCPRPVLALAHNNTYLTFARAYLPSHAHPTNTRPKHKFPATQTQFPATAPPDTTPDLLTMTAPLTRLA